jgi:hypothetical protein
LQVLNCFIQYTDVGVSIADGSSIRCKVVGCNVINSQSGILVGGWKSVVSECDVFGGGTTPGIGIEIGSASDNSQISACHVEQFEPCISTVAFGLRISNSVIQPGSGNLRGISLAGGEHSVVGTRLRSNGATSPAVPIGINLASPDTQILGCFFSGFTNAVAAGTAIAVAGTADRTLIDTCRFTGCYHNVEGSPGTDEVTISDCHMDTTSSDAVDFSAGTADKISVSNCQIDSSGGLIFGEGCTNISIQGCTIIAPAADAISLTGTTLVRIMGNEIRQCGTRGIYVTSSAGNTEPDDLLIQDNIIDTAAEEGIHFFLTNIESNNVTIAGNLIKNTNTAAGGAGAIRVEGGTPYTNTDTGLSQWKVVNNTIVNTNGEAGITVPINGGFYDWDVSGNTVEVGTPDAISDHCIALQCLSSGAFSTQVYFQNIRVSGNRLQGANSAISIFSGADDVAFEDISITGNHCNDNESTSGAIFVGCGDAVSTAIPCMKNILIEGNTVRLSSNEAVTVTAGTGTTQSLVRHASVSGNQFYDCNQNSPAVVNLIGHTGWENLRVDNNIFGGCGASSTSEGVIWFQGGDNTSTSVDPLTNLSFSGNQIILCSGRGIVFEPAEATVYNLAGLKIEGNIIQELEYTAIYLDFSGFTDGTGDAKYAVQGVMVNGNVITTLTKTTASGVGFHSGVYVDFPTSSTVRNLSIDNNEISDIRRQADTDAWAIYLDGGGGGPYSDISVSGNNIWNDDPGGIYYLAGGADMYQWKITNNIINLSSATNACVFWSTNTAGDSTYGLMFSNNSLNGGTYGLFYGAGATTTGSGATIPDGTEVMFVGNSASDNGNYTVRWGVLASTSCWESVTPEYDHVIVRCNVSDSSASDLTNAQGTWTNLGTQAGGTKSAGGNSN